MPNTVWQLLVRLELQFMLFQKIFQRWVIIRKLYEKFNFCSSGEAQNGNDSFCQSDADWQLLDLVTTMWLSFINLQFSTLLLPTYLLSSINNNLDDVYQSITYQMYLLMSCQYKYKSFMLIYLFIFHYVSIDTVICVLKS